jgi:hypothetical protein
MGQKDGLDAEEKEEIFLLERMGPRPSSPSLYRLSYPGSLKLQYLCYYKPFWTVSFRAGCDILNPRALK